jgi:hypothetical protein
MRVTFVRGFRVPVPTVAPLRGNLEETQAEHRRSVGSVRMKALCSPPTACVTHMKKPRRCCERRGRST